VLALIWRLILHLYEPLAQEQNKPAQGTMDGYLTHDPRPVDLLTMQPLLGLPGLLQVLVIPIPSMGSTFDL
jgi:hypothetical protein